MNEIRALPDYMLMCKLCAFNNKHIVKYYDVIYDEYFEYDDCKCCGELSPVWEFRKKAKWRRRK